MSIWTKIGFDKKILNENFLGEIKANYSTRNPNLMSEVKAGGNALENKEGQ